MRPVAITGENICYDGTLPPDKRWFESMTVQKLNIRQTPPSSRAIGFGSRWTVTLTPTPGKIFHLDLCKADTLLGQQHILVLPQDRERKFSCTYPKANDNEQHPEQHPEDYVACERQRHDPQERSCSTYHNRGTDFAQGIAYAHVLGGAVVLLE